VAEHHLVGLISADFPQTEIRSNVRDLLPSGLEVDILLPSLKLAIELNGPLHFLPIYGQQKLSLIQGRDYKKQQELQEMGYSLILIDVSQKTYRKKLLEMLDTLYASDIKPIILAAATEE
jgi:hypothetical protein